MQVSVRIMPRRASASAARRSSATIASGCLMLAKRAKSAPRGSVTVGTRTRRSAGGAAASSSRNATPEGPSASLSAQMCTWLTSTRSSASKNSPTATCCSIAQRRGAPSSPASIRFS